MSAVAEGLPGIQRDLLRYALTLTRNAPDADDLVQDTCLRALSGADKFELGTSLQRWCFGIMRNLHTDNWRNRARRNEHLERVAVTSYEAVDGGQEAAVLLRQVLDAASRCRTFFTSEMAMDAAGCSINEICERMGGLPDGTVKNRIHRSRKALRAAVRWDEGERQIAVVRAPRKRRIAGLDARDAHVFADYQGGNSFSEMSRRYRLSRLRIRQIVRAQQAEAHLAAA